jgi:hypothetical protein
MPEKTRKHFEVEAICEFSRSQHYVNHLAFGQNLNKIELSLDQIALLFPIKLAVFAKT